MQHKLTLFYHECSITNRANFNVGKYVIMTSSLAKLPLFITMTVAFTFKSLLQADSLNPSRDCKNRH